MDGLQLIFIDRISEPTDDASLTVVSEKGADVTQESSCSSKCGGSPLKFHFMTLKDLETLVVVLKCKNAKFVRDGVPFDLKTVCDPFIWVACDATDFHHTALMGLTKKNKTVVTYQVGALGEFFLILLCIARLT
ncbi:unnamed protein product [Gongylonema pulchrum]|uniref:DBD_Tnp_Mut domain-containing protein n=1 Tax=Gongylonema pulchrum TaxID=637853 RepID=A0A183D1A6_9BILA|nr:unnamed protein product [Gongylonema pulchrum]